MSYTVVQKHEKEMNHHTQSNLTAPNEFTKGKQNYWSKPSWQYAITLYFMNEL